MTEYGAELLRRQLAGEEQILVGEQRMTMGCLIKFRLLA